MLESISIGVWDGVLVGVVSIQATVLAYLHHPLWKGFMLLLPIPFTIAFLALGRPVDATNILGLVTLLVYAHGVRFLRDQIGIPIIPAIVLAALSYCVIGGIVAQLVPATDSAFAVSAIGSVALGGVLHLLLPDKQEPGYRSPLPIPVKLAIIIGVICVLVILKQLLKGFMAVFPMVGVVGSYEARHSLWTMCRQVPLVMLMWVPMMVTLRVTHSRWGVGIALVLAWIVLLILLIPYMVHLSRQAQPLLDEED
jgi:hypothetical protein